MIAPLIAGLIVVLIANRVGHWLDNLNTGEERVWEGNRLEWDFTLAGIFIATLAYLVIDHLMG
jgi:hypothetical protein